MNTDCHTTQPEINVITQSLRQEKCSSFPRGRNKTRILSQLAGQEFAVEFPTPSRRACTIPNYAYFPEGVTMRGDLPKIPFLCPLVPMPITQFPDTFSDYPIALPFQRTFLYYSTATGDQDHQVLWPLIAQGPSISLMPSLPWSTTTNKILAHRIQKGLGKELVVNWKVLLFILLCFLKVKSVTASTKKVTFSKENTVQ